VILSGFARRLLQLIPVFIAISFITFIITRLTGDPTDLLLPLDATSEAREALRENLGLDGPLWLQYLRFMGGVFQGDFGDSFRYRQPALGIVVERIPATLELAGAALGVALLVGLPLGIIAALKHGTWIDNVVQFGAFVGQAMPTFYTGLLGLVFIAINVSWIPSGGYEPHSLRHLVLPALTLAPFMIAIIARFTRSSVLDVMGRDYVRTARAKGITEQRVTFLHILRNALIPVVTIIGLQIGALLGGAVITEVVFGWPGIGRLAVTSVLQRDFPVVQAIIMLTSVAFVLINQIVDVIYTWLDPRIDVYGSAR
jgi:peptide/nickel transport system permease protein